MFVPALFFCRHSSYNKYFCLKKYELIEISKHDETVKGEIMFFGSTIGRIQHFLFEFNDKMKKIPFYTG